MDNETQRSLNSNIEYKMSTDTQKKCIICNKLIKMFESKNCAGLAPALNEISSSDEMVALTTVIDNRNSTFYMKLGVMVNAETTENLSTIFDFIQLF